MTCSRIIFEELQVVWKCGQTLSSVFDISSQSKLKLRSKQRNRVLKIDANYEQISKHHHSHDIFFVNLMNYS